jgi:hypothetical protein
MLEVFHWVILRPCDLRPTTCKGQVGRCGLQRCVSEMQLLADEQMARAMKHQAALLLGRLGRDEPHVGSRDRLADGLGVCRAFFCRLT